MGTRTPANVDYKSTALPTELYVHIWRDNWSRTSILQNITADIFCTSYQLDQVPYFNIALCSQYKWSGIEAMVDTRNPAVIIYAHTFSIALTNAPLPAISAFLGFSYCHTRYSTNPTTGKKNPSTAHAKFPLSVLYRLDCSMYSGAVSTLDASVFNGSPHFVQ